VYVFLSHGTSSIHFGKHDQGKVKHKLQVLQAWTTLGSWNPERSSPQIHKMIFKTPPVQLLDTNSRRWSQTAWPAENKACRDSGGERRRGNHGAKWPLQKIHPVSNLPTGDGAANQPHACVHHFPASQTRQTTQRAHRRDEAETQPYEFRPARAHHVARPNPATHARRGHALLPPTIAIALHRAPARRRL
jgi:hypothetical protein